MLYLAARIENNLAPTNTGSKSLAENDKRSKIWSLLLKRESESVRATAFKGRIQNRELKMKSCLHKRR